MPESNLWAPATRLARLDLSRDLVPRLESWDASTHPSQMRLAAYLDGIAAGLEPLPEGDRLYLEMVVDVQTPDHLHTHHDLDNYLYPVIRRLGCRRFVLVRGEKRVGGGSYITIGLALPATESTTADGWTCFRHMAGSGAAESRWKAGLWSALHSARPTACPAGGAKVRLAWCCSMGRAWYQPRNWAALWKPTIDAMGPVLGPASAQDPTDEKRFQPDDGRIVSLELHLVEDPSMGFDVDVAMWWRTAK